MNKSDFTSEFLAAAEIEANTPITIGAGPPRDTPPTPPTKTPFTERPENGPPPTDAGQVTDAEMLVLQEADSRLTATNITDCNPNLWIVLDAFPRLLRSLAAERERVRGLEARVWELSVCECGFNLSVGLCDVCDRQ